MGDFPAAYRHPRSARGAGMTSNITAQALRDLLLAGSELALLDVREQGVHYQGHPFFACSLPLSRIELMVRDLVPRLTAPLVLLDGGGEGLAERAAIHTVFGARAAQIPIITLTPAIGNCGAGNGAIAAAVAVRCLTEQRLPARINTAGAVGLDANACATRAAKLNAILVFTPSLGGQNAAAIIRSIA